MKNLFLIGLGVMLGAGAGLLLVIASEKCRNEPKIFKKTEDNGDIALRDTERALSRANF